MSKRMKLSFSIPSKVRPTTHPAAAGAGFRTADDDRDSVPAPLFITVFGPSQNLTPDVKPAAAVLPPFPNSGRDPNNRSREPTGAPTGAATAPNNASSSHTSFGLIVRNTAAAATLTPAAVIPPLPNSVGFLNHRSREPAHDSTGAGTTPNNTSSSHTSYGLNVRNYTAAAESADAATEPPTSQPAADGPSGDIMLRRYKEDMALLPDQPGEDEYDEVPVEGFGAALLAGYGWKQGDAIGKNSTNKEAKVIQYDRRAGAQGLGYEPASKKRDMETRDQMRTSQQGKDPGAGDSRQAARSVSVVNYKVPCLHSHIRVRMVSNTMSKRLYMMKGRVVDVTGPTTCDIVMDDGTEVVQGVEQDMLETVVPPVNGHALVLYGKHKGVYGRLVEKNPDEQTGVLEDADTKDMVRVELDKIAEYVGDPELIGY